MTSRAERWGVPLLLGLLTCLFFLGVLVTKRYVFPWDAMAYYYPMTFFLVEHLKQFSIPLWNPHIFAGIPAIADPQVSTFYPSKWLLAVLSAGSPLSYKWYAAELVLHYFLAGLFLFRFLRGLGLLPFAAVAGAFTFMFSGALVGRAQHHTIILAVAWVPLLFHYTRRAIDEGATKFAVTAGMIFGLQLLAGHPQTSVYTMVALAFYCVWKGVDRFSEPRPAAGLAGLAARFLLVGLIGAGIAAVQLLPTAELSRLSVRAARPPIESDFIGPLEPIHLIKLFLPNFWGGLFRSRQWLEHDPTETTLYLGILPLLLIAIAVRFLDRKTLVWAVGAVFFLLLAMADFLYWPRLFYYLAPQLNLFARHGNYFIFTTFCLAVLAAYGMDALWRAPVSQNQGELSSQMPAFVRRICLWGLGFASLALTLSPAVAYIPEVFRRNVVAVLTNQIIAVAFFFMTLGLFSLVLRQKLAPWLLKTLIVTVMVLDVFTFNSHQRFNQDDVSQDSFLSPRHIDGGSTWPDLLQSDREADFRKDYRVGTLGLGGIWHNAGTVAGYLGVFGYDPIALKGYTSLLSQVVGTFERAPEFDAAPDLNSAILDSVSMKYLLVLDTFVEERSLVFPPGRYELVEHRHPVRAYLNKQYVPRAFVVPSVLTLPPGIPAASFMASPAYNPAQAALVEASEAGRFSEAVLRIGAISVARVVFVEAEDFTGISARGRTALFDHAWNQKALVDWGSSAGERVSYRFDVPEQSSTVLFLRYAMGASNPAVLDLFLDGAPQKLGSLECPQTPDPGGAVGEWKYASANLGRLSAGTHELTLASVIGGPLHLDALVLADSARDAFPRPGWARILESEANSVGIETRMETAGVLVLSDVDYPGWEARVDDRPAQILRVNSVFRGIPLGQGTHRVEFHFRPKPVYLGAGVSLATLLISSYCLFLLSRRGHGRQSQWGREEPQRFQ